MRSPSYRSPAFDTKFLNPTPATALVRLPYWRLGVLLLVAHLLQTTWLEGISFFGVKPDLAFLVALCTALLSGPTRGAAAGLGAGYLASLTVMWHPGSFIFSRLLPCLALGALSPRFGVSHPFAPPLAAVFGVVFSDLIFLVLSPTDASLSFWLRHALTSALLHGFLIWPVFALARHLLCASQKGIFR